MVSITTERLSSDELRVLQKKRPSFVWRKQRARHRADVASGECVQYVATVRRAWELKERDDDDGSYGLLLDCGGRQFLFLSFETPFPDTTETFPETRLVVRGGAQSRLVVRVHSEGSPVVCSVPPIASPFGEAIPDLRIGDEVLLLRSDDLGPVLRRRTEAA